MKNFVLVSQTNTNVTVASALEGTSDAMEFLTVMMKQMKQLDVHVIQAVLLVETDSVSISQSGAMGSLTAMISQMSMAALLVPVGHSFVEIISAFQKKTFVMAMRIVTQMS